MTTSRRPHLFCFGLGYSAAALATVLRAEGWLVSGTCRSEEKRPQFEAMGLSVCGFDRANPLTDPTASLDTVTDVLASVPPDSVGDPVLDHFADAMRAQPRLRWIGYLSTTGVYGDTGGAMVNETSRPEPTSERSRRRLATEQQWLRLHRDSALPVHVFRLAGIYGPGRSALDQVRSGQARRIHKPGHVFSRIHVDDLAQVLRASMARPNPGSIYNVCDDLHAEQSDVVAFACRLLGLKPPPPISFETAMQQLSPMARSFWRDNRRVDNSRIKTELAIQLRYADYRAGLTAILAAETSGAALSTVDDQDASPTSRARLN